MRLSSPLPVLWGRAMSSGQVERHYDKQAQHSKSRKRAIQERKKGKLYNYKRFANAVKRNMFKKYAKNATLLLDLGCGRGGDIAKWRDANIRKVLAIDLSNEQLQEAKRRDKEDLSKRRGACSRIEFIHTSMMQPELAKILLARPESTFDQTKFSCICAQFAIQYAFSSEKSACDLLRQVGELLDDGGLFFGIAPCAESICNFMEKRGNSAMVHLAPPDYPFSLRLKVHRAASNSKFGHELIFSLEDTVTAGSESDACTEFLLDQGVLKELASRHGLFQVEMSPMAVCECDPPEAWSRLSSSEREVASLYFSFCFEKRTETSQ